MENYELVCKLGAGNFGTVSKVRRRSDGKYYVWKEVNYGKMSEKEKQLLVDEVNILRELRHPGIVRYHDRIIDREHTRIFIVMEYCEGGDLATLVKRCRRERSYIDEEAIWRIFTQLLEALGECHSRKQKILHRDLKPANVFLDGQQNVKLGDFGLARVLGVNSKFAYTNVGTPYYMSPEQVNEVAYNDKSDVWSLGCVLYELAALRPPFEASNQLSLAVKIKEGRLSPLPERYSSDLWRMIRSMLQVDMARRPSIAELLQHPTVVGRSMPQKETPVPSSLRAREEELLRREAAVAELEKKLQAYEAQLKYREAQLLARERSLREQESAPPLLGVGGRQKTDGALYVYNKENLEGKMNTEPMGIPTELVRQHSLPEAGAGHVDFLEKYVNHRLA